MPFGITIDYDTVDKNLVTLREALSMKQVQIPLGDVTKIVKNLCSGDIKWEEILQTYPLYEGSPDEKDA